MTSKLLAPMIKHLSQTLADALVRKDTKTAKEVKRLLSNPHRLNRELDKIDKIEKGELAPEPESFTIDGKDIAARMEMSAEDPNTITNGGQNWNPDVIDHVKQHNFKEAEETVDDLINYDPSLLKYIRENPDEVVQPEAPQTQGPASATALSATSNPVPEPIILGGDGLVKDGYKRIAALKRNKLGQTKIKVLVAEPSKALSDNADNVVLDRIGGFVENINKLLINSTDIPMRVMVKTKQPKAFPLRERMGFAGVLKKATTLNNGKSVNDDVLISGFAVDVLKVLKDNTGGKSGGKVFSKGNEMYLAPKNENKLGQEVGAYAERRIFEAIENKLGSKSKDLQPKMTPEDRTVLGVGLITMARGNFGNNRDLVSLPENVFGPANLKRPSLLEEKKVWTKDAKGQKKQELMLTTSDYYNNWFRTPVLKKGIQGNYGKRWVQLFDGPINPSLPAIVRQGDWIMGPDGKPIKAPLGVKLEDFIAGGSKSKYSQSSFDPEVLNILNKTKAGVDPAMYAGWKYFSMKGYFQDSGMTNKQFKKSLEESGLTTDEMELVVKYFNDVAKAKQKYIEEEDRLRIAEGVKPLTVTEKLNAFRGKRNKVRESLTKQYKEESSGYRNSEQKGFEKIDNALEDLLDMFSDQNLSKDVNTSQRAIRKRAIKEIDRRFKLHEKAEVHTIFKFDYRGRVYAIDPSGANVQTGGFLRHTYRFSDDLAVDVTYGDPAFLRIVDDIVLFEDFPIGGAKVGKSESSGLERNAYWKKNEAEYLRRGKELLEAWEKGITDESALNKYVSKAKWLKNRGDAGPYVSALLEIARIRRAYETPSRTMDGKIAQQQEMFGNTIIPGEKQLKVFGPEDSPQYSNQGQFGREIGVTPRTEYDTVNKSTNAEGVTTAQGYASDFINEPAPRPYKSNWALEVDAPQSGSQHINAQYGQTEGLIKTSVYTETEGVKRFLNNDELAQLHEGVPPESVAPDLYRDVSVSYDGFWRAYLDELKLTDPVKAEAFDKATKTYMKSGRGVTKPIVMKIPYGAGDERLKADLFKQLTARNKLQLKEQGIDPSDFMAKHWNAMEKALKQDLETQYEFKEWMRAYGNIYSSAPLSGVVRDRLLVKSPFGGVSDFTVFATTTEQLKARINPKRAPDIKTNSATRVESKGKGKGTRERTIFDDVQYTVTEITAMGPNDDKTISAYNALSKKKKEKVPKDLNLLAVDGMMLKEFALGGDNDMYGGLAPNATHNIDAGFLQKLVVAADKVGIPVMVVHDAFFIRPTDVDRFRQLAGSVFQDLHNGYNLRKEMIDSLSKSTGIPVTKIITEIENHLKNKMPKPEKDSLEGFRSGYFDAQGNVMDRTSPESMNLKAEEGGPLGPQSLFAPEGVLMNQKTGANVNIENVIRGG